MIYILAVPSIITSATGAVVDIMSLSGKILFHGQTNSGGITFAPTLIYSSGALPRDDTASGITNLVIGLQSAYS